MNKDTAGIRKDYVFYESIDSNGLSESSMDKDPVRQFSIWFEKALELDPTEANAMFLATCTKTGKPSLRTILLKGFDENGFIFFTNYSSRKGKELNENPFASLLFFWKGLERQVRIEGKIERVSRVESEKYFHSRPSDSQIAALASDQSSVIPDRKYLENKFNDIKKKFHGSEITMPEDWGGYRLIPEAMEFWQGRQNRLHDRILYELDGKNWKKVRLAP